MTVRELIDLASLLPDSSPVHVMVLDAHDGVNLAHEVRAMAFEVIGTERRFTITPADSPIESHD